MTKNFKFYRICITAKALWIFVRNAYFCLKEDIVKKFLIFFLVLILAAGFVSAQEFGLTAGLEFGLGNINKANDSDVEPYLMPMVIYENAFLDGVLDLYAELDYTLGFGNDDIAQSLYIDLSAGYNLSLGSASTLSFILENEFDEIEISPNDSITGIFTPAIKFNQEFDFGDVYAKIGLPITYFPNVKDDDSLTGLDFTVGWGSSFGLGIEAIFYTLLAPSEASGYYAFETTVSYESGPLYCELNVYFPKETESGDMTITPEVDYSFGSFTAYLFIEFSGIGVDGGEVVITPALGIKYSF